MSGWQMRVYRVTPHPTLPLKGGGNGSRDEYPSALEGEGRVGSVSLQISAVAA
jgi:hypothetical protein